MGGVVSILASGEDGRDSSRLKPGLGDIPESCAASVLMHLSPPDICKLARLNRAFHGAASADFVWESKLPVNYRYLVEDLFEENPENFTKKEIFARLCQPNPIDDGKKVLHLIWVLFSSSLFFVFNFFFLILCRRFGWRREQLGFACPFLQRRWR